MLYDFVTMLARWTLLLACGIRVRRLAPTPSGGLVVASNHQSYLDPAILAAGLDRPLTFMARDTLFRNPLFGGLIRALGAFPIRRDRVGKDGLRQAVQRLESGRAVLVFAEGTRTRDGEVGPTKDGAGLLSRMAGVPVLPAAVDGAYRAWPRDRRLPRPHPVRVAFGRAIPAARFRQDPEGARAELETEIRSLHRMLSSQP